MAGDEGKKGKKGKGKKGDGTEGRGGKGRGERRVRGRRARGQKEGRKGGIIHVFFCRFKVSFKRERDI